MNAREGARNRLIAALSMLKDQVENSDKVLSRWSLERLFDELASAIASYTKTELSGHGLEDLVVGCSLLYNPLHGNCYVGGASRDRRKMNFDARYYRAAENWLNSFSAFSMATNARLALDDFGVACEGFASQGLSHTAKDCELKASQIKSFYCYPIASRASGDDETREIKSASDLRLLRDRDAALDQAMNSRVVPEHVAIAALRITCSSTEVGEKIAMLLRSPVNQGPLFDNVADLIRSGVGKVGNDATEVQLNTLADFFHALPEWRDSEYHALDQVTAFLQAMFDRCEVSIFEAHLEPPDDGADRDHVALRLAATTALGDQDGGQHRKFREHFYKQGHAYHCYFRRASTMAADPGVPLADSTGKTAKAYYKSPRPHHELGDKTSVEHPDYGEIESKKTQSFLAFAIPSTEPAARAYGVVRIVSGTGNVFADNHRSLAGAVGGALRVLSEWFPKREDLEVHWALGDWRSWLQNKLLTGLQSAEVAREFNWLLQKVFHDLRSIEIFEAREIAGGLAFSVRTGDASQRELLCLRKDKSARYRRGDPGWRETRNLRAKVESLPDRLYPELRIRSL